MSLPQTETMSFARFRQQLTAALARLTRCEARFVLTHRGEPIAAVVSVADLRRLEQLDQNRAAAFAVFQEMRDAFADVSQDEIEREATRTVAEARAELQAERVRAAIPVRAAS